MKNYLFIAVVMFFVACSNNEQLNKIQELEKSVFNDKTQTYDKEKSKELIALYVEYAKENPKDTLAPKYLFHAGELAMSLSFGNEAIQYFNGVNVDFPTYEKAPTALFLQAFVYETQLFDTQKAGEIYTQFVAKYPKHELADDAQASINNLGKTPEELVKEFEAKNAGK